MGSFSEFIETFKRVYIEGDGFTLMREGLIYTVIMAVFALFIGVLLGIIVAIFKVIPHNNFLTKTLNAIANVYIAVIRGTPVMVQLLLAYYAIFVSAFRDFEERALVIAIIIFGINSSAYVAEIIRSGILAVDKGQMEAGRSLGLSYATTMKKIVLPQAIKNILPALGNEFIVLIKETSVAGFITVFDLTRATRSLVASHYTAFVPYITLAVVYLVLVLGATLLLNALERRMRKGDNR